jgi:hypothetical protein
MVAGDRGRGGKIASAVCDRAGGVFYRGVMLTDLVAPPD